MTFIVLHVAQSITLVVYMYYSQLVYSGRFYMPQWIESRQSLTLWSIKRTVSILFALNLKICVPICGSTTMKPQVYFKWFCAIYLLSYIRADLLELHFNTNNNLPYSWQLTLLLFIFICMSIFVRNLNVNVHQEFHPNQNIVFIFILWIASYETF